jgi:hypothetical protein
MIDFSKINPTLSKGHPEKKLAKRDGGSYRLYNILPNKGLWPIAAFSAKVPIRCANFAKP